jgi:hypothetical protein
VTDTDESWIGVCRISNLAAKASANDLHDALPY